MKKFDELKEKHLDTLKLYVPVVARVHGGEHPEFHEVHEVYKQIAEKLNNTESEDLELEEEFKDLRRITDNYTVPADTCESYEAVYKMLSELDETYNS